MSFKSSMFVSPNYTSTGNVTEERNVESTSGKWNPFAAESTHRPLLIGDPHDSSQPDDFNNILFEKLAKLSVSNNYPSQTSKLGEFRNRRPSTSSSFAESKFQSFFPEESGVIAEEYNAFHLPMELQGGVSNISTRRPSYAAEVFTSGGSFAATTNDAPQNGGTNPLLGSRPNGMDSQAPIWGYKAQAYPYLLDSFGKPFEYAPEALEPAAYANPDDRFNQYNYPRLNEFNQYTPGNTYDGSSQAFQPYQPYKTRLNEFQSRRLSQFDTASFAWNGSNQGGSQKGYGYGNSQPPHQDQNQYDLNHGNRFSQGSHGRGQQRSNRSRHSVSYAHYPNNNHSPGAVNLPSDPNQLVKLDSGLLLTNNYIMASKDLKQIYKQTLPYFGYCTTGETFDTEEASAKEEAEKSLTTANEIMLELDDLLDPEKHSEIQSLVSFLRNLNNLSPYTRHSNSHGGNANGANSSTRTLLLLTLVMNKNGKMEILCLPNSNLFLQKHDLVVIDGDRGKDLVMILKPMVDLKYAILFNFLRKREHLKSLYIQSSEGEAEGSATTTSTTEDNEFIISLPTKQVLRFATPQECHQLPMKYMEECKSFLLAKLKIEELGLAHHITLIQSEYQFDFKKLIFYYFAGFQRVDFRGLIKELFKVYKTRIWLCAVLPDFQERERLNTTGPKPTTITSIEDFEGLNEHICDFHSLNILSLVQQLKKEIVETNFYGFKKINIS
ncbi:hypothetical protein BABINDRAFT_7689 [Babjeviella inositovora NRRL Y-12698]|uniref:PSP1 C-terminal domain-containing protein n=1 Tax=Babjeviella inositovora NRRL Y-12698 TaxID=984486 RepID=A0A1E3QRV1_9ASCO|nr:uncharacterized protein BABINDRAFT_7689 [Babjeviella inositovora NRRL Y-12698]ODQ80224.1 hypothetical protein BABINDRAFT_7689 [Babjeviella inositovora NRRL Y-12698]